MYTPLIKALNHALSTLSKINVPGLPNFEERRQLVFARSDAKSVESESHLQSRYKPDIVLLRWETFKQKLKTTRSSIKYSDTYLSDTCCKSGTDQSRFNWRNLLSTLEVKNRGDKRAGGRLINFNYTSGFEDLSVKPTVAEPPAFSPPAQCDIARSTLSTGSRMSVSPSPFARPLTHLSPAPRIQER